ncbi:P-loop NTPase fold protein, partial [Stenotrophomonas maltophilia]|uniref:P-loop NTPase fold protein n=1 Tax=Stenotrophomonas maltophilia TaxID=40324 RepID=UPI003CCFE9B6
MSLQSPWGSGKTVFLQRLALHMAGTMRIPTVTIDAWKTDDCADPLVAIVAQLTRQLEAFRVQ